MLDRIMNVAAAGTFLALCVGLSLGMVGTGMVIFKAARYIVCD